MNATTPRPLEASSRDGLLAFLAELSQQLAVSVDLARTLRESAAYVARYLRAEAVSVFLVSDDGQALECRACQGPVDILGLRIPVGKGIVGRTVARNEARIVRDARADPDFSSQVDSATGFRTRSVLCVPLTTAQGVIGAIEVINGEGDRLFDEADLTALRLLAAPMALALNAARMSEALVEQQRIRRELTMARRLQRSLLPRRRRGGYPVRALNLAAREISGDFYDFFDLPDGRIAFIVGDVAGKGLDASFLMVRCASLMRWIGKDVVRPADWLARVNDELGEALAPGMFVCAVAGHYDPATREAVWANAGFPPVLRLGKTGEVTRFDAEGPPLGILRRMQFPEQQACLTDASLCLYSDGVTDVRETNGAPLGVEGVMRILGELGDLDPEPRLRAMTRRLRGLRVTDDITLMLISDGCLDGDGLLLEHDFPAQPGELSSMRHVLAAALARGGVGPALRQALVLAVDEACTNIIRHGHGGPCQSLIRLRLARDGDALHFDILDEAPCVDGTRLKPRDLSECRPGGLGLNLIDSLMDEWTLTPRETGCGNHLRMIKHVVKEGGCE